MQYVARWRLQLAARLLEGGSVTASQAAAAVGYQSGGGVQPRVQTGGRRVAGRVAPR